MNEKHLSKVKQLILTTLRSKQFVHFAELLNVTGQKHFDRRIRELKSEEGFDIEVVFKDGDPHYTLKSELRNQTTKRTYLNKKTKNEILGASSNNCPLCSRLFNKDYPRVLDHRIPLVRDGNGESSNYQAICHPCNNQKRSQCRGCKIDCNKCYLAFPEKYPKPFSIIISKDIEERLLKEKGLNHEELEKLINEIVFKELMAG